jgi:hypothetical protein
VNLTVKYRWIADVKDFRMRIKVTKAPERYDFIYPTTEWKTLVLKNMKDEQFEVDEDQFYIDVTGD